MNSKIIRNRAVWIQTILFIFSSCVIGAVHSRFSSSDSRNSLEPTDIFFYDIISTKTTLSQSLQKKTKNMTCSSSAMAVDQSCLVIQSYVDFPVKFQYQSMECDNCTFLEIPLEKHESHNIIFKLASLGTVWQVSDEENKSICDLKEDYLGENSMYHLYINSTGCSLVCDKEPELVYIPILLALGAYVLLAVLWAICNYIKKTDLFTSLFLRDSLEDLAAAYSSSTTIEEKKPKVSQQRLRSLDTVRGIAIAIMIFVNYGGGKYYFFHHARWNGLMVADLVFPWFIWMMGMSMALSLRSLLRKVVSRRKIFFKIVKRSLILFGLGIMLNTATCTAIDLNTIRILGVLQRFSISYFVVATVHLFYASPDDKSSPSQHFRDIVPYSGEWLIMLTFLALHLLLSFLVHAPECPRGYFGPGGLHDQGAYSECTGGAAGYIDRILLGSVHLYQNPSFKPIYHNSLPYDPEGILGYLTSIFLVFLGLQAGKILLTYKESKARVIRWLAWGLITGTVAAILCLCSKNDGWIPVNKNLWSVSFILATGSLAFILLTICYLICDVQKWWSGAPFYQAGMNSIVLYVGHSVAHHMFPFSWKMGSTHLNLLFMDLWAATLWVIIAIWMNYKNVFISV